MNNMPIQPNFEFKYGAIQQDVNKRQILDNGILKNVYIMRLEFPANDWNKTTAEEVVAELIRMTDSIPATEGVIFAIFNCNKLSIPPLAKIDSRGLGRIQKRFGLEILVNPSMGMKVLGSGIYAKLFNAKLLDKPNMEEAEIFLNNAIDTASQVPEA